MKLEVEPDAAALARRGASLVAALARFAAGRGRRLTFAVSGGRTPWPMLRALAEEDVPWDRLEVFQVDERVAPAGHPDRNLRQLREVLLAVVPLPAEQIHPIPVEAADPQLAADRYARTLHALAGTPPVLDVIHLGLGTDGHTASLLPGDPVLDVVDRDVAATGPHLGRRRVTFTYPVLEQARLLLWIVSGEAKREMLRRLLAGAADIPAGRVRRDRALVLADRAAAGGPNPELVPVP